ncbi:DUF262 domain-containing protein [Foetidibacter luteolus]|uniref:DUF262 domain-containing protein n=1 Tax=Foetidibacter luteolus TaxID=2608880 RepID=UPI00129B2C35|nr:DUF262 domain-containing protein [Foetidibacter luteolus]
MEDIFKPQSLTIKQLFGNADALYQIPRYQRPYSWGDEQLDKLWTDLREAQENEPNYFLGSVITAKPEDASNYIDIVDGQQRLTTLLVLLCVYRDMYPEINSDILDKDPFAIDANIIKTSIKFNDRFERLRLKTHSNHESDFQELILSPGAAIGNEYPYKRDLRRQEEPKYKFLNTSAFFTEKLEDLGEEEAGTFINYLFNKVKIIRIDCQSVSFAIKLFQVLNDRGLDLSNSDLIKSFLIGQIHKKHVDDPEQRKQKENQFMDDWKFCETIAIDTEESMNDLFVMYEYYLLGNNPEKSLYDELVREFETKNPNQVIADFKRFVSFYKKDVYNREDSLMYGFWYLRWTVYWKTIVLTALHSGYPSYEEFLPILKRYYYLNWIAGNTLSKIKQTSFNIIKWLKEKRPLFEIKSDLEALLTDPGNHTINRAIVNLDNDVYFEAWCKPLLLMIEYNQQDNPPFYLMSDKNIHIEHVLPRGFMKNPEWVHFNNVEGIEDWINSAANLTLLSGSKNIAATNAGLALKIKAYDGTGNHIASDTKISSFIITQKIVNDYNGGKFNGEWNTDALEHRYRWFCTEVERLLQIDLSESKKASFKSEAVEESNN